MAAAAAAAAAAVALEEWQRVFREEMTRGGLQRNRTANRCMIYKKNDPTTVWIVEEAQVEGSSRSGL